jgi:branched-chain amino acid transport system permease protein
VTRRSLAGLAALAAALAAIALSGGAYLTSLAVVVALHGLPAIGLGLLMGYTGQVSIGHAAFYGLGAYTSALLALRGGLDPWLGLAGGAALAGAAAWGLGWPVFRLRGHHLAVATLGLGIIFHVALVELRTWTGGPNGLSGIPPLALLGQAADSDRRFFPIAWAACILGALLARNLIGAPAGLAMRAVRDSERAAASLGVDVAGLKRRVFVVSAVYAAVGGGLYAHYVGYVSPQPFGVGFSIRLLVMVALGGFAHVWGALVGAAFVTLVGEPLQTLGHYDVMAFGLALVLVMVWLPGGLPGLLRRRRPAPSRRCSRWRGSAGASPGSTPSATSASRSRPARSSPWSAPTGPGRARSSTSWPGAWLRPPAACASGGA